MIYFRHDDAGAVLFEVLKSEVGVSYVSYCSTIDAEFGIRNGDYAMHPLECWIENCGSIGELIDGSEAVHEEIDDFQDFLIKKLLYKASKN